MGLGGQRHPTAVLPSRKRPGEHCTGSWEGPSTGLDGCEKLAPTGVRFPDSPARTFTEYAIPTSQVRDYKHGNNERGGWWKQVLVFENRLST
jgi:hypothetical protein